MRYASLGKRDANEKEIHDALVKAGCTVTRGTDCDLFVRRNCGGPLLMEIKVPGQERALTQLQLRLREIFGEQYVVVSSVDEALRACGRMA